MKCPVCGSENVNVQVVNEIELKKKHHGIVFWLLIGWWFYPIWWIFFTVPAAIIKIFAPKNYKTENRQKTLFVCSNCGNTFEKYN